MKRFLTTTALALVMGTTAMADNHGNMDWSAPVEATQGQFYGSELIGMRVYRSETEYEDDASVEAGANQEWDDIGEINDIIISKDGDVKAVILGIGGFLGMGERDVAVSMDAIHVVREADDPDDRFLVVTATKDDLGMIPEYDREAEPVEENMEEAAVETEAAAENAAAETEEAMEETKAEADEAMDETKAETEEAMDETKAEMNDSETAIAPAFMRPEVEREGYGEVSMVDAKSMTAEELQGTRVYGINDEDLGEISSLLLEDGELTQAVIDVGGFLGIGEKPVAVNFDELQILKAEDGSDLRVYLDATEESLEAQPEHEG